MTRSCQISHLQVISFADLINFVSQHILSLQPLKYAEPLAAPRVQVLRSNGPFKQVFRAISKAAPVRPVTSEKQAQMGRRKASVISTQMLHANSGGGEANAELPRAASAEGEAHQRSKARNCSCPFLAAQQEFEEQLLRQDSDDSLQSLSAGFLAVADDPGGGPVVVCKSSPLNSQSSIQLAMPLEPRVEHTERNGIDELQEAQRPLYPVIEATSYDCWFSGKAHPQQGAEDFFSYLTATSSSSPLDGADPSKLVHPPTQPAKPDAAQPAEDDPPCLPSDKRYANLAGLVAEEKGSILPAGFYPDIQYFDDQQAALQLPFPAIPHKEIPKADAPDASSSKKHKRGNDASAAMASSLSSASGKENVTQAPADKQVRGAPLTKDSYNRGQAEEPHKQMLKRTTTPKPFQFEARAQQRPKSTSQVRVHIVFNSCQSPSQTRKVQCEELCEELS